MELQYCKQDQLGFQPHCKPPTPFIQKPLMAQVLIILANVGCRNSVVNA